MMAGVIGHQPVQRRFVRPRFLYSVFLLWQAVSQEKIDAFSFSRHYYDHHRRILIIGGSSSTTTTTGKQGTLVKLSAAGAGAGGESSSTTASTSTSTSSYINPSSLLYAEHEKLLVSRGEFEAQLMAQAPCVPLAANIVKGSGGGGGFGNANKKGGGGGTKRSLLKEQAKSHAKVLREQGVVRIDNVLSSELADSLRDTIYATRKQTEQLVADGQLSMQARFADVLLTHNRRDMTLPIGDGAEEWTAQALQSILLDSAVGATIENLLGKSAILREWSCLMSDPGSQRQVTHPDTPWQEEPVLYTCFVALQDITEDMGPTTWLPQTHTEEMHQRFQDESVGSGGGSYAVSSKDRLLSTQPSVLGTLAKGACAIFDSRLLHCGGANQSSQKFSRALMYCSFQNPQITQVGNPGSIRSNLIGKWTLQTLQKELDLFSKGKPNQLVIPEGGKE